MSDPAFKRVLVWSGWLRLSHAAVVLSVPVLLLTGWLIAETPSVADDAADIHYIAASLLIFGLVLRVTLMVIGREHERLHNLVPQRIEVQAMLRTFRFYLSFGRVPLPGWYAQNPLWKPVYLAVYIALVMLAFSGAMMPDNDVVLGFYLPSVHGWWAQFVLWFSGLHIAASIWHDLKKRSSDISAMINGYRLFEVEGGQKPGSGEIIQVVDIDSMKKR